MTCYSAVVARELSIPMVGNASIPGAVEDGTEMTIDGERGVVYADPLEDTPHRD
ncbi:MAG: PEP-utilizing enzyme [Halovenus sp.]